MNSIEISGAVATITVGEDPLAPGDAAAIMTVEVDQRVNMPACTLVTLNPVRPDGERSRGLDFELFPLGADLSVSMGLSQAVPIFRGRITAVEPQFEAREQRMTVTAFDGLHGLQFGTRARVFEGVTYSGVISDVLERAGVVAEVDESTAVHPYTAQLNVSNYRFVMALAERLGFEIVSGADTIRVGKPRLADPPVVRLEFGAGLSSFNMRARVLTQGSTVTRIGWDPKEKAPIEGEAAEADPDTRMDGKRTGFQVSEEVKTSANTGADAEANDTAAVEERARADRAEALDGFILGDASCAGNPKLTAGAVVEISKISPAFDGPYYITAATHLFSIADGYRVLMELRRTGI